ncbi:MAG: PDZ domain-containing protein, partial [Gammaproteobacteria bacterium]
AIERLARLNPLSSAARLPSRPAPSAPPPPLRATLKGTSTAGYAILVVEGKERLYPVGSEVVPGARLKAVFRDRVVISGQGEERILWLKENAPPPKAPPPAVIDRKGLRDLIRSIALEPQGEGLRVARLAEGSAISRLGIAQGDVIRAVNGHPVASLEDLAALYREHPDVGRLQVDVSRGGKSLTFDVTIR